MTREHEFLSGIRGNLCVKEFRCDSTPPARDKTRVDTRDKRRETTRDCGGRKQRSRLRVPARSATEFETRGKMEERTGWRGQNESQTEEEKKNGSLYGVAETSEKRAEWRRLQRKNLTILGLPKRKESPQCQGESNWQERRSRPCQNEKEQSRLSKAPDHEGGESQDGREPHLGEK